MHTQDPPRRRIQPPIPSVLRSSVGHAQAALERAVENAILAAEQLDKALKAIGQPPSPKMFFTAAEAEQLVTERLAVSEAERAAQAEARLSHYECGKLEREREHEKTNPDDRPMSFYANIVNAAHEARMKREADERRAIDEALTERLQLEHEGQLQ